MANGFPPDPCSLGSFSVNCFLSDSQGNRLDPFAEGSISCSEIPQPGGRQNVSVVLPGGETVTLQKVKVAKEGFVTVQAVGVNEIITLTTVPFFVAEKFFLCAPPGTTLLCHITDFECDVLVRCSANHTLEQIDVSITMCQDIQIEAPITLEVSAALCQPREEIQAACPPAIVPSQCPTVFPPNTETISHQSTETITAWQVRGRETPQETLCINVQKVFDWVTRQVEVPLIVVTPTPPTTTTTSTTTTTTSTTSTTTTTTAAFACCKHVEVNFSNPATGFYIFTPLPPNPHLVTSFSGDINICFPVNNCKPEGSHINVVFHDNPDASININELEIKSMTCEDGIVTIVAVADLKVGTTTISNETFTIVFTSTSVTITTADGQFIGEINIPVTIENCTG